MNNRLVVVRGRTLSAAQDLAQEHVALVGRLGRLQQRVTEQLQAGAGRQAALEAENLRLRAEVVRLRTAIAWDLRNGALGAKPAASGRAAVAPFDPALRQARDVICQTGCVGHAHPWLDDDGQCRQSGQPCERLE